MLFRLGRLFRSAGRDIVVLWYACRHPETPLLPKLLAVLVAVYVLSPIDLMPDWLAVLGWIDDVSLLALGIPLLLFLVPEHARHHARVETEAFMARGKFWTGK
jgi:uncharacterized membrane protein YkvA (DUF1232 family)